VPSRAASEFPPRRPPPGTQHDGTWYGILALFGQVGVSLSSCVPSWIPFLDSMKINPVLAEHMTQTYQLMVM